jgi:hypothetical protein
MKIKIQKIMKKGVDKRVEEMIIYQSCHKQQPGNTKQNMKLLKKL